MIVAELISLSNVLPTFFEAAEQVTGRNPASALQNSKRPISRDAYTLSYFKALNQVDISNLADIKHLRGFLHVGMLCAGFTEDLHYLTVLPHSLRCIETQGMNCNMPDIGGLLFSGDVEVWNTALSLAKNWDCESCRNWAASCYSQFSKHDLEFLLDINQPKRINGYLTY